MLLVLIFSMLFSTLASPHVVAAGNIGAGWYVKRNKEGKQPVLDPAYSYIEKYDAFYLDRRHGDDCTEKVLYLTFDAGYENGNIEKILDVLKEEEAIGAFFILKNLILRNPDLVRRMRDEGHLVCNHTMSHRDMSLATEEVFLSELGGLERLYSEKIGGEMAKLYRPPEGRFSEENLRIAQKNGYKTVFWSFAYADWDNKNQPAPTAAKQRILENTHNGAILLLHPTSATNAAILGDLIREWKRMGYRFGSLSELSQEG